MSVLPVKILALAGASANNSRGADFLAPKAASLLDTFNGAEPDLLSKVNITAVILKRRQHQQIPDNDLSKNAYALQYVGVQKRELPQPRSPLAGVANRCLTVVNDTALDFRKCQLEDVGDENVNPEVRAQQEFVFLKDGQMKSVSKQLCVRRRRCQDVSVYDLGKCGKTKSARFRVKRSMMNSLTKVRSMGTPLHALAEDHGCTFCGPYLVLQYCKEKLFNGQCNPKRALPGWTKYRSHYVIPERQEPDMLEKLFGPADRLGVLDLKEAKCDTMLSDGPSDTSFFYFKFMRPLPASG